MSYFYYRLERDLLHAILTVATWLSLQRATSKHINSTTDKINPSSARLAAVDIRKSPDLKSTLGNILASNLSNVKIVEKSSPRMET